MEQRDYLEKQLELFFKVIKNLVERILKTGTVSTSDTAAEVLQEIDVQLQLDLKNIFTDTKNLNLTDYLLNEKKYSMAELEKTGDLLFTYIEHFSAVLNQEQKTKMGSELIQLFQYIEFTQKSFSIERNSKINTLNKLISLN